MQVCDCMYTSPIKAFQKALDGVGYVFLLRAHYPPMVGFLLSYLAKSFLFPSTQTPTRLPNPNNCRSRNIRFVEWRKSYPIRDALQTLKRKG